ncbi:serine hydrolase domain-containing protein, partial [candidate division KSB1 bacterium]
LKYCIKGNKMRNFIIGKFRISCTIFILVFFLFHPDVFCQETEVYNPKFEEVRELLLDAVKGGETASISVAVAKDGKIIWEESCGWANREKMIKATPHTMYSMASISKPITATGLMKLVEEGKVDLNKPVNDYISPARLTAYEGDVSDVTVRHILNHTSGLPTHYTCFYLDEPDRQPPAMPESIRRYGIIVFPPGEFYQYANFGFSIADHIISKVSHRSFPEFMKREVFLPLGMTHTSIDVAPGFEEYAAERYGSDGDPVPFYISDHPGASQVYCSAHDLIRFGMFHLKNHLQGQEQILKDKTIDLMKKDSDPNPDNNRYGLGWFLKEEFGYDVVWHTGSMDGVKNIIKFVPSENIAVVVLINSNSSSLRNKIANDIIGALLPEYGEEWKKERNKPREERKPFEPVPELFGEWEGEIKTYEETVPVTMIFQEDGDIHVKIGRQLKTLLDRVRFTDGILTGTSYGTIPSGDAKFFPHDVSLKMKLNKNRFYGYICTEFNADRGYGNFSSYIYVEKK